MLLLSCICWPAMGCAVAAVERLQNKHSRCYLEMQQPNRCIQCVPSSCLDHFRVAPAADAALAVPVVQQQQAQHWQCLLAAELPAGLAWISPPCFNEYSATNAANCLLL